MFIEEIRKIFSSCAWFCTLIIAKKIRFKELNTSSQGLVYQLLNVTINDHSHIVINRTRDFNTFEVSDSKIKLNNLNSIIYNKNRYY